MANRNRTQNQKAFKFKSSGQTALKQFEYAGKISFKKLIGIKTPIEFGRGRDGLFKMHSELKDQIRDNFKNLLQTNHGDRLGNYYYGANLAELAFELAGGDVNLEASNRINAAVNRFMPFVSVIDFNFFTDRVDNEHTAKMGIAVIYDVPQAGISNQKIEVMLRVAG